MRLGKRKMSGAREGVSGEESKGLWTDYFSFLHGVLPKRLKFECKRWEKDFG